MTSDFLKTADLVRIAAYGFVALILMAILFYMGMNSILVEQDMEERIRASRCHKWGAFPPNWAMNYCNNLKY